MTKMIYSDKVYHRELVHGDLSTTLSNTYYYDNVLCGVASGDVEVYSYGIAGACGQEFSFYYRDFDKKASTGNDAEKLLAIALSANNGWGHANEKCFKPLSSTDFNEFLEQE